ncbi:MAG: hypothetical protein LBV74_03405 [Tannerella sp.]|jgi:hypothetical protein|nr:hypothetical protein [Tannerella sp.]
MRKRNLLLKACMLCFILCSGITWAQQGVLFPEKQRQEIAPRRGDLSNPTPDTDKRDTIRGPKDVNVVFGAGESSSI